MLPVAHHPGDRHADRGGDLAQQRGQVLARRGQQAPGEQDLARQAVAHDPQHLVPDIRLQPVERQDRSPLPGQNAAQAVIVGERGRDQLVVAVEQVGDRALRDRHPALAQAAVDLGHAAMLAVAPGADQRDDVEAELVLRQHDGPLGFRPVGPVVAGAGRVLAAADAQPQADQARERGHRVPVVVAVAQPAAAGRAGPVNGLEHLLAIRRRARRGPGHHRSPPSHSLRRSTASRLYRSRKKPRPS
jgi:hypothetical protein